MRAVVLIRLKEDITDAPGRAVGEQLVHTGYGEVKEVRVGKLIELELEAADRANEEARVQKMCQDVLTNELVEEFEILSCE